MARKGIINTLCCASMSRPSQTGGQHSRVVSRSNNNNNNNNKIAIYLHVFWRIGVSGLGLFLLLQQTTNAEKEDRRESN